MAAVGPARASWLLMICDLYRFASVDFGTSLWNAQRLNKLHPRHSMATAHPFCIWEVMYVCALVLNLPFHCLLAWSLNPLFCGQIRCWWPAGSDHKTFRGCLMALPNILKSMLGLQQSPETRLTRTFFQSKMSRQASFARAEIWAREKDCSCRIRLPRLRTCI